MNNNDEMNPFSYFFGVILATMAILVIPVAAYIGIGNYTERMERNTYNAVKSHKENCHLSTHTYDCYLEMKKSIGLF